MKHLFTFLLVLSAFLNVHSQCPVDLILNSQAEVSAWPATCTAPASLRIEGADITDLSPLSVITSIGGNLSLISNASLTNVDGLSGVTSIGGSLGINSNPSLANIDGLSGLANVDVNVEIQNNPVLSDIDGLSSLSSIGGILFINNNSALAHLNGFSGLTTVDGFVRISSNAILSGISGLSGLTSVGNSPDCNNPLFPGCSTFCCPDGTCASASFECPGPPLQGDLEVSNNASLADCCGLYPLLNLSGVAGDVVLSNNLTGCNSEPEILDGGACLLVAPQVPTMGQWGLIILALLLLNLGTLMILNCQAVLLGVNRGSFSFKSMPFEKAKFVRILGIVLIGLILIYAVSSLFFGYALTKADIPGSLIAAPLFAYMIHLAFLEE